MSKKSLSKAQKRAKKWRRENTKIIFINGKQKRVPRQRIDGLTEEEFIQRNADPLWLHQTGNWHLIKNDAPTMGVDGEIPF
jgi:hypothetical protein